MDSSFFLRICLTAIGFFMLLGTILFMFYGKFRFRQNNEIMALSLSSPSSSLPRNWTHEVFPSFCGEDVRRDFFSHIRKEFQRKGITLFIDDEIKRGESIDPELEQAIRVSKIAIVLLSRNYASSSWCLNELVEIIKCREELGQVVMTIFYKVDPTDIEKQIGDFGKVFRKTCKGKTEEVIKRWRQALTEVATIAGYYSSNWRYEADMIEQIATDVSNVLNNSIPSIFFEDLVGIGAHMEKMWPLLSLECDEVRMVGIWGPAGIGKTTIARALYEKLCNNFTHTAFMESIRGGHTTNYLDNNAFMLHLQEQLLSEILNQKDLKIRHLGVAQERLKDKKVLLVLDDVERLVQLNAMADKPGWFGCGSRIIITTQDKKLLKAHGIDHIYKVDYPIDEEALEIFCIYAFGQKSPEVGFEDLAQEVTKFSGKLPLGLRVMGSYFREMSKQEWKDELPRLRTSLHNDMKSILRFSYDALCDEDNDLFLYIACFFSHKSIQTLECFLAKTFLDVNRGLHILAQKSLISREYGFVKMHNLLVQLGREIVRNQSVREPGKRQFLVDAREICEGSTSLVGMDLDLSEINGKFHISDNTFERMCNLQFLRFYGRFDDSRGSILYSSPDLKCLSPKLQLLHWEFFPTTSLPSRFIPEFLVELNMRYSKLEKLWEGVQPLQNLKWVDLSHSEDLKKLPDLSTACNLLSLDLSYCIRLMKLPFSIGKATNLLILNIEYCTNLKNIPSSIGMIPNLKIFLAGCSSLVQLPPCIWNITSLSTFNLDNFSSSIQHPLLWNTKNFQDLDLSGCSSLKMLPSIVNATDLKELYFNEYSSSTIGNATNLQDLNLGGRSSLVELHSSIGNATNLQGLHLTGCSSLVKLPSSIQNLFRLRKLILKGCSKLEALPTNLYSLYELDLTDCSLLKKFPNVGGNIINLFLSGTAIEGVPPSIRSCYRLQELCMSYSEKLGEIRHVLNRITILYLRDTEIQKVAPLVKEFSCLRGIVLKGCRKLVSLPQLPDSLLNLYAENCESLETQDSFHHPHRCTNFSNCFKLDQEVRDLIMELSSTLEFVVVPGGEVPEFFTYRAAGDSVTVTLFQKPLPTPLRFQACILLVNKSDDSKCLFDLGLMKVSFSITSRQNDFAIQVTPPRDHVCPVLTEHLYIFEVEAEDVTSSQLLFDFELDRTDWEISECGVIQLLEMKIMRASELEADTVNRQTSTTELKIISKSEGEACGDEKEQPKSHELVREDDGCIEDISFCVPQVCEGNESFTLVTAVENKKWY